MGKGGGYLYTAIEVVVVKKQQASSGRRFAAPLLVGNDADAWRFVNESMDDIVSNMARVHQMNTKSRMHVDESAELFQTSLEPFFTLISATAKDHVMDKLSLSLRKALLLMAMERYSCNSERMCRALGLTRGKLEKELKRCGLVKRDQEAA
ncbi:MAG TPA: hypothetical protein DCZ75_18385 [Geobacter sp.]|nr:hypothetical protein [Geobacter sp.]